MYPTGRAPGVLASLVTTSLAVAVAAGAVDWYALGVEEVVSEAKDDLKECEEEVQVEECSEEEQRRGRESAEEKE